MWTRTTPREKRKKSERGKAVVAADAISFLSSGLRGYAMGCAGRGLGNTWHNPEWPVAKRPLETDRGNAVGGGNWSAAA